MRRTSPHLIALTLACGATGFAQPPTGPTLVERVRQLTRESAWTPLAAVPLAFPVHHPQGMVKVGDALFVSSVEIRVRTRRLPEPVGGYDRDTGEGVGHLFKLDMAGNLIADLRLGEGTVYHPGGIDYDGTSIWVPVAEYRPNGRSIVYRVDPATMKATEMFRFEDHIGAVVYDTESRTLHGVSWGSRRFYGWGVSADGTIIASGRPADALRGLNGSHYVDYQDCQYAGAGLMLCTGLAELRQAPDAAPFRLGGMDLIVLHDGRSVHGVPLLLWAPGGRPMTQNPSWFEPTSTGLRGYFIPDDDKSTLYSYEVNIN
jgi:hypothetical protein